MEPRQRMQLRMAKMYSNEEKQVCLAGSRSGLQVNKAKWNNKDRQRNVLSYRSMGTCNIWRIMQIKQQKIIKINFKISQEMRDCADRQANDHRGIPHLQLALLWHIREILASGEHLRHSEINQPAYMWRNLPMSLIKPILWYGQIKWSLATLKA